MRRLLRLLLLEVPLRFYEIISGDEGGVPWPVMLGYLLLSAAVGGVGALVTWLRGTDVADGFGAGLLVGFLIGLGWLLYCAVVLIGVWLWCRTTSQPGSGRHRAQRRTRVAPDSLRTGIIVFAVLMLIQLLSVTTGVVTEWPYRGELTVVRGEVTAWQDTRGGWGERFVVAQLPDGHEVRVRAEDVALATDASLPDPGSRLDVEQPHTRPDLARPVGTAQAHRDETRFDLVVAAVCGVFLAGLGWLTSRRRVG